MKIVLDQTRKTLRRQPFLLASMLCFATLFSLTGCNLVKTTAAVPENTVHKFFPDGKAVQPLPDDLRQSLMHFASTFSSLTLKSVDELTEVEGSPFTRERALRYKSANVSGVVAIATRENPNVNLLDMVELATLSRMVLEDHWITTTNGALFEPWFSRSQTLENNIWLIADRILAKEQQDELRHSIEMRYASLTNLEDLFLFRPQDLLVKKSMEQKPDSKSVFSLAALDPLSGLDPAVREITKTRLFAARALYSMQWMPLLVRLQSELLVLETTSQPRVVQALEDTTSLSESIDRLSKAAETISETAAGLPAQVADERKAIIEAMNMQEGQITTLFQAGTELSVSMNTAIESLDALMKRFGVGEPHAPRDPNRKRFDILDYAKTADSFTATAEQLNETLLELNTTLDSPALDKLSNQTKADVRGILNHAFLLAAGLVVLVLVCTLIYRRVSGRAKTKSE